MEMNGRMLDNLVHWLFLVVCTEAVTELLVDSDIFSPVREFINKRGFANPAAPIVAKSQFWSFLARMLKCGYCTSFWAALPFSIFTPWLLLTNRDYYLMWFVNYAISVFILHRGSNWLHVVYMLIKKGRVKTYDVEIKHTINHDGRINGQIRTD